MSVSHAFLIGVDAADDLPAMPFAADEVRALAVRLEAIGIAKPRQTVLTGNSATRSAIESRLRRVTASLAAGDDLWFVFAGPACVDGGRSYLACSDTLGDDRDATSLPLSEVVKRLLDSGLSLRCLLDAPCLDDEELARLFPTTGTGVALTASEQDQASHAANGRRLWLQLVGDVLAGQAPDALDDGSLTARALRDWTAKELPRTIRKVISSPGEQTPGLFGPGDSVVATITSVKPPAAKLDLKKLKRIVFRGESRDRVRNLSGFQKNFKLPEAATPSAQKWVYRLASDDLKTAIEETYNALREQLGFKRKDLESTLGGDGLGFVRTPLFDFTLSVSLDPDDPTSVIWRREISQVRSFDVLSNEGFRKIFAGKLESLQFEFEKPIDVEALVDRIEAEPPSGVSVRVASDGSSCDVTVKGFAGRVHVGRKILRVEGPPGFAPASLVEQFFAFQARFGGKKGLPALRN